MKSKTIKLTIKAEVEVPEPYWSGIRDYLGEGEAEIDLHSNLRTWLWRYMPLTLAGSDLTVQLTVE